MYKKHTYLCFSKSLGMVFSIVENVPTSRESIFMLSRGSQRPYRKKTKNKSNVFYIFLLKNDPSLLSPYGGLYVTYNSAIAGCAKGLRWKKALRIQAEAGAAHLVKLLNEIIKNLNYK